MLLQHCEALQGLPSLSSLGSIQGRLGVIPVCYLYPPTSKISIQAKLKGAF